MSDPMMLDPLSARSAWSAPAWLLPFLLTVAGAATRSVWECAPSESESEFSWLDVSAQLTPPEVVALVRETMQPWAHLRAIDDQPVADFLVAGAELVARLRACSSNPIALHLVGGKRPLTMWLFYEGCVP